MHNDLIDKFRNSTPHTVMLHTHKYLNYILEPQKFSNKLTKTH